MATKISSQRKEPLLNGRPMREVFDELLRDRMREVRADSADLKRRAVALRARFLRAEAKRLGII